MTKVPTRIYEKKLRANLLQDAYKPTWLKEAIVAIAPLIDARLGPRPDVHVILGTLDVMLEAIAEIMMHPSAADLLVLADVYPGSYHVTNEDIFRKEILPKLLVKLELEEHLHADVTKDVRVYYSEQPDVIHTNLAMVLSKPLRLGVPACIKKINKLNHDMTGIAVPDTFFDEKFGHNYILIL